MEGLGFRVWVEALRSAVLIMGLGCSGFCMVCRGKKNG